MMAFTVVLFSALATSIVNASPIPFSNAVPSATTIEAGLPPVYTPPDSPVHSKMSEVHDHCEDPRDNGPPYPSSSGFAKPPLPESGTVSGSGSVADYQQVMSEGGLNTAAEAESAAHYQQYRTSHGLDAAAEPESAAYYQRYRTSHGRNAAADAEAVAHYQQYRTSHGLNADDSDRDEKGKNGKYENDGQSSWDLGHHPHLRHQNREGSDCSMAASGVLCRVKQDAGPVQDHEDARCNSKVRRREGLGFASSMGSLIWSLGVKYLRLVHRLTTSFGTT